MNLYIYTYVGMCALPESGAAGASICRQHVRAYVGMGRPSILQKGKLCVRKRPMICQKRPIVCQKKPAL